MIYTVDTSGLSSTGAAILLYEIVAQGGAAPPTGVAVENRIMAGSQNAITIREVTIGGYN